MALGDIEDFRNQMIERGLGTSPVASRRIQQKGLEELTSLRQELLTSQSRLDVNRRLMALEKTRGLLRPQAQPTLSGSDLALVEQLRMSAQLGRQRYEAATRGTQATQRFAESVRPEDRQILAILQKPNEELTDIDIAQLKAASTIAQTPFGIGARGRVSGVQFPSAFGRLAPVKHTQTVQQLVKGQTVSTTDRARLHQLAISRLRSGARAGNMESTTNLSLYNIATNLGLGDEFLKVLAEDGLI